VTADPYFRSQVGEEGMRLLYNLRDRIANVLASHPGFERVGAAEGGAVAARWRGGPQRRRTRYRERGLFL
jgi:hypothetical protein